MDKRSTQERSIRNKGDGSGRVEKSKVAAMQLQLLPPDVLRDILTRLSLKEVTRLSILSREWRRLRICHPDLVLTQDTFFGKTVARHTDQEPWTTEFITKVDNLLGPLWSTSTTTTTTLDKFAIKFCLGRKHKYHIDRWVKFSTVSRAKHIALDFTMQDSEKIGSEDDKYVFPLCNLSGSNGSFVKSLDLGYVCLKLPPSFCGIMNLKKLTLNKVSISRADLQGLLLSCAFLESLSIEFCSFTSLCLQQELSRLQCLRLRYCHLEMIELHAPNLTRFEFDDYQRKIVVGDCLKLSEATFLSNLRRFIDSNDTDFDYAFPKLPTAIPCVHRLVVKLNFNQVVRFSNTQTSFINLRHLNMNLEIFDEPRDTSRFMELVNILQLAPLLEELEIHLGRYTNYPPFQRMMTTAQGPQHHHLNSVYISGFCDALGLAELTLYMLENATVLERMVVDPVSYGSPYSDHIYSASKAGSIKGNSYGFYRNRIFAEEHLDREKFGHILTIL